MTRSLHRWPGLVAAILLIVISLSGAALSVLTLALSGLFLVARRTGGWRRFFTPLKGPLAGRIHVEIARVAAIGFALSSVTALWMTAGTFGLLPEAPDVPPFPAEVSGQTGFAPTAMDVLRVTPADRLRDLTFPQAGDASDVYTLQTDAGTGYIDQGNGALLAWQGLDGWGRAGEIVYMLHTGQGAPLLGLVLGLMTLGIPAMAVTGTLIWARGRRARPRIRANAAPGQAETVLLVGSEGGSTWGFAATLHAALTAAGQTVHTAPMSGFAPGRYSRARRIIALAATYGEGDAPASAKGFIDRLAALDTAPGAPLVVLGFGDRSFPGYCAYAEQVTALAAEKGWAALLPLATVDRQSPQDFTRWGRDLGAALGLPLELNPQPVALRSAALTLIDRRDYGAEVQALTAILRFALPRTGLWHRLTGRGFGGFEAGDLLGILPEGSDVPRLYSLASSRHDGFAEICVRKHPGGICSGQLLALAPGDSLRGFIRHNPAFRPVRGKAPVILIGAGAGIGPLAGFIRANRARRPMHLYFGARHPESDMLYDRDLVEWYAQGRLASLATAYSRTPARAYVQDASRNDASALTRDIAAGAQVLVCAGLEIGRPSGGAFDIGMEDVVTAWGFGAAPADPARIRAALAAPRRPAQDLLELDPANRRAREHAPLALDLSGIAKGYGVDRWPRPRALGLQPDGQPWSVAVERPDREIRAPHAIVTIEHAAIATSGDYRHWVDVGGTLLGHTMDPRLGGPLAAEAFATALMVLGETEGRALASRLGLDALFRLRDGADLREVGVGALFAAERPAGAATWPPERTRAGA